MGQIILRMSGELVNRFKMDLDAFVRNRPYFLILRADSVGLITPFGPMKKKRKMARLEL